MDEWLGAGAARVILPITDSYVLHHGSLGSCAMVYLSSPTDADAVARRIAGSAERRSRRAARSGMPRISSYPRIASATSSCFATARR